MKFENLFKEHRGRHSSKWHHYFEIYDRHLSHLIGKSFTLLEIGIAGGGSLQLWKKYFGSSINIIGIDINEQCYFEESQIKNYIGDQTDSEFLLKILKENDQPNVIIDDGSHIQSHVIKTFKFLYPKLSDDGIYIVEDCHTSYWPRFEGGVNSHLNFVEIMSNSVHDVNTKWFDIFKEPRLNDLNSIHFYDSMIVCEKKNKDLERLMVDVDENGARIMERV